jgi:uncharacterized HAD superfamily protein
MSLKIGCDLDGVLVDFVTAGKNLMTSLFPHIDGTGLSYDDHFNKLSKPEQDELWDRIKNGDFWLTLEPIKEAEPLFVALNHAFHKGHEIYFITSRPGNRVKYYSEQWLLKYLFNIPTVIISKTHDGESKGKIAAALDLDIMIEDTRNYALMIIALATRCEVLLINQPWNEGPITGKMHRVDWEWAAKFIKERL